MASCISKIISPQQGAFLLEMNIFENFTLIQEMIQVINRKYGGGNILIKVDMAKAYDRMDWSFLNQVLKKFGFYDKVCHLLSECVKKAWFRS